MPAPKRPAPVQPRRSPPPPAPPPLVRTKELNHGCPNGYVKCLPDIYDLPHINRNSHPVLYAVIGTWMEEDIIFATVKNCFANGASKVFLVDNDSWDGTCAEAVRAGAVVARTYKTAFYDDDLRLRLMNEVMQEVSIKEKLPELWWLSLDADEFPVGPQGQPILEHVRCLDPAINCVGANALDLYPTELPHYEPEKHPADYMSMGMRRKAARGIFCLASHWKHPLLRVTNGDYTMAQSRGSHVPYSRPLPNGLALFERPVETLVDEIWLFHAPIRAREATFKRLQALCDKQSSLGDQRRCAGDDKVTGDNGSIKRWRSLEAIYNGHWDKVELPHSQAYGRSIMGIALIPWRRLLPDVKTFPRWYDVLTTAAEQEARPGKVSLDLLPPDGTV